LRDGAAPGGPEIRLEFTEADPDRYFVLGHDSRLGQVFNNLVDNARSFCRNDGIVRIVARAADDMIEVIVEDDGPGIRPDQFERIFERFYTDRADNGDRLLRPEFRSRPLDLQADRRGPQRPHLGGESDASEREPRRSAGDPWRPFHGSPAHRRLSRLWPSGE
jgi:hypothetical protein